MDRLLLYNPVVDVPCVRAVVGLLKGVLLVVELRKGLKLEIGICRKYSINTGG